MIFCIDSISAKHFVFCVNFSLGIQGGISTYCNTRCCAFHAVQLLDNPGYLPADRRGGIHIFTQVRDGFKIKGPTRAGPLRYIALGGPALLSLPLLRQEHLIQGDRRNMADIIG